MSYDGAPGSAALLHVELASAAAALPARSPGVKAAELDLAAGPRIAPNPVRRAATLHVVMAHPGPLRVELFDVQGRRVRTLMDLPSLDAGSHAFTLEAVDEAAAPLRNGLYFYAVREADRCVWGRFVVAR